MPIEIHVDYFGNEVGTFTHSLPHNDLSIDSRLVVITRAKELPADSASPDEQWSELDEIERASFCLSII